MKYEAVTYLYVYPMYVCMTFFVSMTIVTDDLTLIECYLYLSNLGVEV